MITALQEYAAAAAADPHNPAWAASLGESYARLGRSGDRADQLSTRCLHLPRPMPSTGGCWRHFVLEYNLQLEDIGLPAAQKAVELSARGPARRWISWAGRNWRRAALCCADKPC